MSVPRFYPFQAAPDPSDWMEDRLSEARGILADAPDHPDTLVILAARLVLEHASCSRECSDAAELLRLLDGRSLHVIEAAAAPNGGAA